MYNYYYLFGEFCRGASNTEAKAGMPSINKHLKKLRLKSGESCIRSVKRAWTSPVKINKITDATNGY